MPLESPENPESPDRRVRFVEHYCESPPWLLPFGVLLRADGHLCTVEMRAADKRALAARYSLALNGQGGLEGRAFPNAPSRAQLRQLWMDLFDAWSAPFAPIPAAPGQSHRPLHPLPRPTPPENPMGRTSPPNPELHDRRVRFVERYCRSPPWFLPFGVLLRADGHLCTVEMRTADRWTLARRYGLTSNVRGGLEGRAFPTAPTREQLRQLWMDLFDAHFAAHPFPEDGAP
ncbi:MAG: hypothetical protein FJ086_03565 [Deltaproteobacteria bacterium]|nr:hypothetical protein [Deltaproteobacteria bacterium]